MTVRIHDYRNRYWGHDYTLRPNPDPITARIIGWGYNLREGDLLIIPRPEDAAKAAFYRIESLEYKADPPDMWFSTCRFTAASSELGQRAIEAMCGPMEYSPADPLSGWWEFAEALAGGDLR